MNGGGDGGGWIDGWMVCVCACVCVCVRVCVCVVFLRIKTLPLIFENEPLMHETNFTLGPIKKCYDFLLLYVIEIFITVQRFEIKTATSQ